MHEKETAPEPTLRDKAIKIRDMLNLAHEFMEPVVGPNVLTERSQDAKVNVGTLDELDALMEHLWHSSEELKNQIAVIRDRI